MHDLVVLRPHLGDSDAPARGGGLLQHHAHRGAALPHRLDEVAHAARSVGVLVAVFLLVARRLGDAHARPVGLHLVGDHHRQAGPHAGAHLGAVGDDGHQTGRVDGDEDVRVVDRAARHLAGAGVPGRHRRARQHARRRRTSAPEPTRPFITNRRLTLAMPPGGSRSSRTCVSWLTLPSRPGAPPPRCADSSRNGRCCRTWRTGCPGRSAWESPRAARRPA